MPRCLQAALLPAGTAASVPADIGLDITHCPLCSSRVRRPAPAALANLYSEQLAQLTGMSEGELLAQFSNVECTQCGLIYKQRWFLPSPLHRLFESAVAAHPRGWDVISERFSFANFSVEVGLLESALANSDVLNVARYQRALGALVDSMPESAAAQKRELLSLIAAKHIAALRLKLPNLKYYFAAPFPFKRFAGFSAPELWQWLEAQLGPIAHYGELGCPLWGFLSAPVASSAKRSIISRAEANYWGKSCVQNGQTCVSALHQRSDVQSVDFAEMPSDSFDVIGLYQYLDHVNEPMPLLRSALIASKALALIVDSATLPCAIQHVSAWSAAAIAAAAKLLNCRVVTGFAPIERSGNALYLLQRHE